MSGCRLRSCLTPARCRRRAARLGLGIIEQKVIKKVWPLDDTEKPKKKSGFMARLMELQQQQLEQKKRRGANQRRT